MKKVIFIVGFISLINNLVHSQNSVQDLIVEYKPEMFGSLQHTTDEINCKPQITVYLNSADSVASVDLKISILNSDSLIYHVNYNLSNNQTLDGEEIFSKINNQFNIKGTSVLKLQPYRYEVYTTSILGKQSEIFTKIQ